MHQSRNLITLGNTIRDGIGSNSRGSGFRGSPSVAQAGRRRAAKRIVSRSSVHPPRKRPACRRSSVAGRAASGSDPRA
jgi:hypothetical protein